MVPILNSEQKLILQKYSLFYHLLADETKQIFEIRLALFLKNIKIEGIRGLEVNEEIRVITAISPIIMTIGLDEFIPQQFIEIYLFPDAFISPLIGDFALFEIHLSGKLFVSWRHTLMALSAPDQYISPLTMAWAIAYFQEHYMSPISYFKNSPRSLANSLNNGTMDFMFASGSKLLIPNQLVYCRNYLQYFFALCIDYYFNSPQVFSINAPVLMAELDEVLGFSIREIIDSQRS